MAWPRADADWPVPIEDVYDAFVGLLESIRQFEPVHLVVDPEDHAFARQRLPAGLDMLVIPLNDSWMRDIGPTFVKSAQGDLAGVDWEFNGWGKFPCDRDRLVAQRMLDQLGLPRIPGDWVNEGGAIHVNGEGTCLLTRSVQLNTNRNPTLSDWAVEQRLRHELGATDFVWLPRGLVGDDTDGHVDELACFAPNNKLLAAVALPGDDNHSLLQDNLRILRNWAERQAAPVEIIELPLPPTAFQGDLRLSRSYVNFYIANGGVVMPSYGEPRTDELAKERIQACFPDREVCQVDCSVLVTGGGNIHCLTQQQPI